MNTDSCTDEQLQGSPVDRRAVRITSITDSKHVPVESVRDLEWGRKSNKLIYIYFSNDPQELGRQALYVHACMTLDTREAGSYHGYICTMETSKRCGKGERIEVQKRRPHSASKSESRVTQTQNTPTKCTYHINHSHGRRIASRKNA